MTSLANYQKAALETLRTRLNPEDPANTATDEVKAHLRAIGPWLSAWVMPLVDTIDSTRGTNQYLRREAIEAARGIRRRRRKINFSESIDKRE